MVTTVSLLRGADATDTHTLTLEFERLRSAGRGAPGRKDAQNSAGTPKTATLSVAASQSRSRAVGREEGRSATTERCFMFWAGQVVPGHHLAAAVRGGSVVATRLAGGTSAVAWSASASATRRAILEPPAARKHRDVGARRSLGRGVSLDLG